MRKILLPTDFSANALNAIYYALELNKDEYCEFYILNVVKASAFITDDLMAMPPTESLYESLIESSQTQIDNLIIELKDKFKNEKHKFISKVDYDNFIDAINQLINSEQIDLIIMGTKGASNIDKILFGSNTIRVIQRGICPVLSVPNNFSYKPFKKIIFLSNYLNKYDPKDLEVLVDLVDKQNYKIEILHIKKSDKLTDIQTHNKAFIDEYFSNYNHEFIELEQKEIIKSITNYISNQNVNLLAMMSKKHTFLERLFNKHIVEKLAFNLNIPLLVMENNIKKENP